MRNLLADRPRRSRPRFTVRFLLVLVVFAALPLAWVSNELCCYRREYAAAAKLESEFGATLMINSLRGVNRNVRPQFDWNEIYHGRLYRPIVSVTVVNQSLDESFLTTLAQFRTLPSVEVRDSTSSGAGRSRSNSP